MDLRGVKLLDVGFVFLFDRGTADFQRGRQLATADREFYFEESDFPNFFKVGKVGKILRAAADFIHRQIVYLGFVDQFGRIHSNASGLRCRSPESKSKPGRVETAAVGGASPGMRQSRNGEERP